MNWITTRATGMRLGRWVAIALLLCALGLTSCSGSSGTAGTAGRPAPEATPPATDQPVAEPAAPAPPPGQAAVAAGLPQLTGEATVVLTVNGGSIVIAVDGTHAPVTAGNFVDLVQKGVYDGLSFHRVVREPVPFVVQGGDPKSKNLDTPVQELGTGSYIDPKTQQPRYIPLEIQPDGANSPIYSETFEMAGITASPVLTHRRGAVAMARSPAPDSASSQFYIALEELPPLDGNYAVFGYVTEGMDVVDAIEQGDRIEKAVVQSGAENLQAGEV